MNLTAPIMLTRLALPHLRKRPRGAIVNVASIAGKIPVGHEAVYSTTKFGLRAVTFALVEELQVMEKHRPTSDKRDYVNQPGDYASVDDRTANALSFRGMQTIQGIRRASFPTDDACKRYLVAKRWPWQGRVRPVRRRSACTS